MIRLKKVQGALSPACKFVVRDLVENAVIVQGPPVQFTKKFNITGLVMVTLIGCQIYCRRFWTSDLSVNDNANPKSAPAVRQEKEKKKASKREHPQNDSH